MTANLIAYWSHAEAKRHNAAVEAETNRANVAREDETARHNLMVERETYRSNIARESETHRANVAYETELNRSNVARETETQRHNMVSERETTRHNKAQEDIGWANIGLGYSQLAESIRHNQAVESETARYNAAYMAYQRDVLAQRSLESDRSYDIDQRKIEYQGAQIAETKRHNLVSEGIDRQNANSRKTQTIFDGLLGVSREARGWTKDLGTITSQATIPFDPADYLP